MLRVTSLRAIGGEGISAVLAANSLVPTLLICVFAQSMCINEFRGLTFEPDANGRGMTDGEQVGG